MERVKRPAMPSAGGRKRAPRSALLCALVLMLSLGGALAVARPAAAADSAFPPPTPLFDRVIDAYLSDYGPTVCSGFIEQPGVVAFRDMILALYPSTGRGNIYRCDPGNDPSDHREGRAWDWIVDAGNAYEAALADRVLNGWLLRPDDWDYPHAMLRRLGIKYIIWNRRIWTTTTKRWETHSCDGTPGDCHTNHVHFSFAWPGARKQTSWWTGPKIDGPAVAALADRLDVFVRHTDGAIRQRTYNPSTDAWSAWQSLGGFAKAGPAAVWWNNQLHVFVRGADDMVWQRYWTSSAGWSTWASRFGPVESQPAAAVSNGTLLVLAKDRSSDRTKQWRWTGSGWAASDLGGGSRSGPGATQYGSQFQVTIRGTDDHIYHRWFDGGWSDWEDLLGGTYSKPEPATGVDGFHVFVRGTDGRFYQRVYRQGTGWAGWALVSQTVIRSAPAAAVTTSGYPHVFAYNAAGNVVFGSFFGATFSGFTTNIGGTGI